MLTEIKYLQNIGRFEKAIPTANAGLGRCTLVFGENGWGKSTLADILRSLSTGNPAIIVGRKTLASGPEQKAILRVGGQQAVFESGTWTGPTPRIAIYDSAFTNENVFSGDVVSADHLKNQYGLVVGEEGVKRVRRMVALDDENREINTAIRSVETQIDAVVRAVAPPALKRDDFLALAARGDVNKAIGDKDAEVQRARRAKEIKAAAEPQLLPVPTEIQRFSDLLDSHIDGIAEQALTAVRAHIVSHEGHRGGTSHEAWLEAGSAFVRGDNCPFCGQELTDRALVDAYKNFFSAAYKALADGVQKPRETFARYRAGDFRKSVEGLTEQNDRHFRYWKEVGKIDPPGFHDIGAIITAMEEAAARLDALFHEKQTNLTQALPATKSGEALVAWDRTRTQIAEINGLLGGYLGRIKAIKDSIDQAQLPRLEVELKTLQATKRRYESDIVAVAAALAGHTARKKAIAEEKATLRDELNAHGRAITATLGTTINAYLGRLNAGFRIDYREPDYRGKDRRPSTRSSSTRWQCRRAAPATRSTSQAFGTH